MNFAKFDIARKFYDIDIVQGLISWPKIGADIIVYDGESNEVGRGLQVLFDEFFTCLEIYPEGFDSTLVCEGCDPDIAAWLLVCAHLAGLVKYQIRGGRGSWNIIDPNRPDNSVIADMLIDVTMMRLAAIPRGYARYKYATKSVRGQAGWRNEVMLEITFEPHVIYLYPEISHELNNNPRLKGDTIPSYAKKILHRIVFGVTDNIRIVSILVPTI